MDWFPVNRGAGRGGGGKQFSLGLLVGLDVGGVPYWSTTKEIRIREFLSNKETRERGENSSNVGLLF